MTAGWLFLHSALVGMPGLCCSSPHTKAGAEPPADTSITAIITGAGGEVSVAGYARVAFSEGSFGSPQRVELRIGSSKEIAEVFEGTAAVHRTVRSPWEVTIRTGMACAARGVRVELAVPPVMRVPRGHAPMAFALIFQEGGQELLDGFERIATSRYNERTRTVTAELPPEAFTSRRHADRVCEAVLVVATAPLT